MKWVLLLFPFLLACAVSASTQNAAIMDAPTAAPTVTTIPTLTDYPFTVKKVVVLADTLRVRNAPSTGAEEIGILTNGDIITVGILFKNNHPDCSEWYPIQPRGWVCAYFVR